jgi:hypothetical protein
MKICIKVGSQLHCYMVPIVELPVIFRPHGPGPVNYPQLFQDGVLIASLQAAAKNISDSSVRSAIENGIGASIKALEKRGGGHVSIEAES